MRQKDETRKDAILAFANNYFGAHYRSPAIKEIAAGTGIPATTVHRYLLAMHAEGRLEYKCRRNIVTTRIKKTRRDRAVPLLLKPPSTDLDFEENNVLEYFRFPETVLGEGTVYVLSTDAVLFKSKNIQRNGHFLIRVQNTANQGNTVLLELEAGSFVADIWTPGERSDCQIKGVVTYVIYNDYTEIDHGSSNEQQAAC